MAKQRALPGILDKKDRKLHDLAQEVVHCKRRIAAWKERLETAESSITATMERRNLSEYCPAVGGLGIVQPAPKVQKPRVKEIAAADEEEDRGGTSSNVADAADRF